MNGDLATLLHVATFILFFAASLAGGASMSALWLARGNSNWSAGRLPALRRSVLGATVVALLASIAVLCLESASMAEVPLAEAGPAIKSMLSATHYGASWTIGAAALVLAVLLNALAPARLARFSAMGTGAALLVFWYTRSMVSHAASEGDISLLMLADWAHLALISLWVGEVLVAGLVTLPGNSPGNGSDRRDRAAYVATLSTSATLALAGIFATGLFGAWRNLGSFAALLEPYGLILLAKLAVVGLAVLLGGFNRFIVMPAWLAAERAGIPAPAALPRRFRFVLQVETVILLIALGLAVVLASTSPPGSAM